MLDRIQGLNSNIDISVITSLMNYDVNSNSQSFEMVLINLLNSIKEQGKDTRSIIEEVLMGNNINELDNIKFNNINLEIGNLNIDERIENAIDIYSQQYKVDKDLIKSIIKVESNFNPNAVSTADAKGLMQIMPENFSHLGINDPFNIEENINGGVKLIKEYLDKYDGNTEMALMAYNGGPGTMQNRGVASINDIYKMPTETQNYVTKVMSYYRGL